MNDFSDDTLLARWLSGELSPEEERTLRARPDFADFERIVRTSDRLRPPAYDAREALARLRQAKSAASGKTSHPSRLSPGFRYATWPRPYPRYAVAAAILLLLLGGYFLFRQQATRTIATRPGERQTVQLTDGSTVRLNAVSRLTYTPGSSTRTTELVGEAYFEVTSDERPFVVETALGSVKVVGTTFNVATRGGRLEVACREGVVVVSPQAIDNDYALEAGDEISFYGTDGVLIQPMDTATTLDWLSDRSAFRSRPLGEVIAELERQFDLTFEIDPTVDLDQRMTTAFAHDRGAKRALETVFGALPNLRAELRGRRAIVTDE